MKKEDLFTKEEMLDAIYYVGENRKSDTTYYLDDNKEIPFDKWDDEFDKIVDQLILYERKLKDI